jgi:hypothetical protein
MLLKVVLEEVMMIDLVFYAGNSYEQKNWVQAATNFY